MPANQKPVFDVDEYVNFDMIGYLNLPIRNILLIATNNLIGQVFNFFHVSKSDARDLVLHVWTWHGYKVLLSIYSSSVFSIVQYYICSMHIQVLRQLQIVFTSSLQHYCKYFPIYYAVTVECTHV